MVALLLLVPAVWITWVLFRDVDSDKHPRKVLASREPNQRDREPRAGE